jgi:hypothetical protein
MFISVYAALSKEDVLETIQSEWTNLHVLVLQVPDPFPRVESAGEWSVKDMLTHLCWGERWMVGQLGMPVRGLPAMPATLDPADQEQRNRWFSSLDCNRPQEELLAELEDTHRALLVRLQRVPETMLNAPFQVNPQVPPPEYSRLEAQWRPLWPMWRWVMSTTIDRYRQHLPDLEAWAPLE